MNFAQTVMLGAIAGFTIYFGLPLGRVERSSPQVRTFLTMLSAGILIFLFVDIFVHIKEPIEEAIQAAIAAQRAVLPALGLFSFFVIGFAIGLVGLVIFEMRVMRVPHDATEPLVPVSAYDLLD